MPRSQNKSHKKGSFSQSSNLGSRLTADIANLELDVDRQLTDLRQLSSGPPPKNPIDPIGEHESAPLPDSEWQKEIESRIEAVSESFSSQIEILKDRVSVFLSLLRQLEGRIEDMEQYSRRTCLIFHGLPESPNENTDEKIITFCNSHLSIELSTLDLDRSHRLGKQNKHGAEERPRPIIAKFSRYRVKENIYGKKKLLKGKGFLITESLTAMKLQLLAKARKEVGPSRSWTIDGRIFIATMDGRKISIANEDELKVALR